MAGKCAGRSSHEHWARRRICGNHGGHEGVADNGEGSCWNAIKRHARRSRKSLSQNLNRTSDSAKRFHQFHEWRQANVQTENRAVSSGFNRTEAAVKQSVGVLHERVVGERLRKLEVVDGGQVPGGGELVDGAIPI